LWDDPDTAEREVGTAREQSGTFMHELGHSLGLGHGGGDEDNDKPNYLSVMNYAFQTVGITNADTRVPVLDYSREALDQLDEDALLEIDGIGDGTNLTTWFDPRGTRRWGRGDGSLDWDWSSLGVAPFDTTALSVNLNNDVDTSGSPVFDTLDGFDDWSNLAYSSGLGGVGAPSFQAPSDELTHDEALVIEAFWRDVQSVPTATLQVPDTLTGDVIAHFSEPVHGVSIQNFVLRRAGAPTNLASTVGCFSAQGSTAPCASPGVMSATLSPAQALIPGGEYEVLLAPPSTPPVTDAVGNALSQTEAEFRGSVLEEETSAAARYGWQPETHPRALGGSLVREHLRDATASVKFDGSFVTWYTRVGDKEGLADVYIDGRLVQTVNNYAKKTRFQVARVINAVGAGPHTLTIAATGLKGDPAGRGSFVTIDAVLAGAGGVELTPIFAWQPSSSQGPSPATTARSNLRDSDVRFSFHGTGVILYTIKGPDQGKADLFVDGLLHQTINNRAHTRQRDVAVQIRGLRNEDHTLRVVVRGKRRGSDEQFVSVDRWQVLNEVR
jgi:hypothetical protein